MDSQPISKLLINRNQRLKFILFYILLTVLGLFFSSLASKQISFFIRHTILAGISTQAVNQVIIKSLQWLALRRYAGIGEVWLAVAIASQFLNSIVSTYISINFGTSPMPFLPLLGVFLTTGAESIVLFMYAKSAWRWLAIDIAYYVINSITSIGLRLYSDESNIFLAIGLLASTAKLLCLCLLHRRQNLRITG